ncbi:hypothetical protein J1614_008544 [Plenodomus biglobosus]|nr:hypothetical protein J1614_008544 [Plenodomus biglobosus]
MAKAIASTNLLAELSSFSRPGVSSHGITDVATLQTVVANLKQENELLQAQLKEATAEIRASSYRAQFRHTEKLRADRNAERFEQALNKERWEREDDQIKAMRCYNSLNETIARMQQEKEVGLRKGNEDSTTYSDPLGAHEGQIAQSQRHINAQNEQTMGLKAALAACRSEQAKQVQGSDTPALEGHPPDASAAFNVEAHKISAAKLEQAEAKLTQERNAFDEVVQGAKAKFKSETLAIQQKIRKTQQEEVQKRVLLQQQLDAKVQEVSWCKQQLRQQRLGAQAPQNSPQSNVSKHGASLLAQERRAAQCDSANKRQRLNSAGAIATRISNPQLGLANSTQSQHANPVGTQSQSRRSDQIYHTSPTPVQRQSYPGTVQQNQYGQNLAQQKRVAGPHGLQLSGSSTTTGVPSRVSQQPLLQQVLRYPTFQTPIQGQSFSKQISPAQSTDQCQQMGQSYQMSKAQRQEHAHKILPHQQPSQQQPKMSQQPISRQPISQQPISQQPISQQPISQQPISQQPISQYQRLSQPSQALQQRIAKRQASLPSQVGRHIESQVNVPEGKQGSTEMSYGQFQAQMHQQNHNHPTMGLGNMPISQVPNYMRQVLGKDATLMQSSTNPSTRPGIVAPALTAQNGQQLLLVNATFKYPSTQLTARQQSQRNLEATRKSMGLTAGIVSLQAPMSSNFSTIMQGVDDTVNEHHDDTAQLYDPALQFGQFLQSDPSGSFAMNLSPATMAFLPLPTMSEDNGLQEDDHMMSNQAQMAHGQRMQTTSTGIVPSTYVSSTNTDGLENVRRHGEQSQSLTIDPSLIMLGTAPAKDDTLIRQAYSTRDFEDLACQSNGHGTHQPSAIQRKDYSTNKTTKRSHRRLRSQSIQTARRTPAPNVSTHIACVHCHSHWWEHSCEGQPCTNCTKEGVDCTRPKCANFAGCAKGQRCKLVHENDPRYHDPTYLITLSKAGAMPKRIGTKANAKEAPTVLGKRKAEN